MPFGLFQGKAGSQPLDRIEAKVQEMLRHDRHEFDLAMSALMGDRVAADVNNDLRSTDQKVNRLEREIRRELLVHASVFKGTDLPTVLVYMSIVKDIERVGDYAKNLLDLALDGANFGELENAADWRRLWTEISQYIADAGTAFRERNVVQGRRLTAQGDALLDRFDDRVSMLVKEENPHQQVAARALAYRYLKRVVAHLMNMLSAVTMPIDQLDYFDEDPEDRG
jgi:phosphate uptake regulator